MTMESQNKVTVYVGNSVLMAPQHTWFVPSRSEFLAFKEMWANVHLSPEYQNAFWNRAMQLVNHLQSLKSECAIIDSDIDEIMKQFSILELRRQELEGHAGEVVVVYDGELFFGEDLTESLQHVQAKFGDLQKRYYSETIDISGFPSIYDNS